MPKWEHGTLWRDGELVARIKYVPPLPPVGVVVTVNPQNLTADRYSNPGVPRGTYEVVGGSGLNLDLYKHIREHPEETLTLRRQDGVEVAVRLLPGDQGGTVGFFEVPSGTWPSDNRPLRR